MMYYALGWRSTLEPCGVDVQQAQSGDEAFYLLPVPGAILLCADPLALPSSAQNMKHGARLVIAAHEAARNRG